jgi:hypothetical protein
MSHYGSSHVKMYYKYVCLSRGAVQLTAFFGVCDATKFQWYTVANTIVSVPPHP